MQSLLINDSHIIFDTELDNSLLTIPQLERIHSNTYAQFGPQPTVVTKGLDVLDAAYAAMFECRMAEGVQTLVHGLAALRAESAAVPDDWRYFAETVSPAHPIAGLIQQDPLTMIATAPDKGANALLDYIYNGHEIDGVSITGRCIATHTTEIDLVRSLRSRRSILAQRIDEAGMSGRARILVIGAGGFHEGELSEVATSGRFEEFVVVDEDAGNLKAVNAKFGKSGVETVQANLRQLLARYVELSGFDLVYAPTLLDNLPDMEARRIAELMFSMVRPGGRVLLVNAGDALSDTAYREAFLDWTVKGRSETELVALTNAIPSRLIGQVRLYRDEYGISNFVELFRR